MAQLKIITGKHRGKCFSEFEEVKFPIAIRGSKIAGFLVFWNKKPFFFDRRDVELISVNS